MTLPSTLAFGIVQFWGGILGPDQSDPGTQPDVRPLSGTVTFTPSVPVALVTDSPRSRTLAIQPFRFGLDGDGLLRDGSGNDGATLIATDSPGLSRQDWTWVATFNLSDGVTRPPFPFRLPADATVDLTDEAPVQQSAGVAITRGMPGPSAYEVAVAEGFTGTPAQWLASLVGPPGDPADLAPVAVSGAYADLTGKPTIPSKPSDIGAQSAGDYATTQAVTDARARVNHTGTQTAATIADLTEAVQDIVGAFFGAGTGASVTYNDAANTITISATGTSDPEAVRDAIGAALIGIGNIAVAINDAADTITISTTATANSTDAQLRDRSTHTGTQPASSVTGLAAVATSGAYADLTGKPTVFMPQTYGALADGVHDDGPALTACIQAALAAAPSSNAGGAYEQGARVWLPAGTYRIATPVALNLKRSTNLSNEARRAVTLVGEGDTHTVLLAQTPASTYALSFRGGSVSLVGIGLRGSGATTSYGLNLGADDGDSSGFVNQFTVEHCTFRDMGRFVNLAWAFDGHFSNTGFTNLAAGATGLNVPQHSTDNCNNLSFTRCHFEPAPAGGALFKAKGNTGSAQVHHGFLFNGCHFETRSFGSRALDLELVNGVSFVACQVTQNSDPGDSTAASAAVAPVRLVNTSQVSWTSTTLERGAGTGWPTKLLALGGRNPGLLFAACFLYPGQGVANASKSTVWASDATTPYIGGVTPFRSIGTTIADLTAAAIPDEILGLVNPNSAAELWTQRFDPATRRLVFGLGATGGDWASGRNDRLALGPDGGLAVGSYLAAAAQTTVAAGASNTFSFAADNNPGRRGFYLIAANDEGDAFALVYSSAQALWPLFVGSKFAVGTADPAAAGKYNVFLSGFDLRVTNRTTAASPIMVLPVGFL